MAQFVDDQAGCDSGSLDNEEDASVDSQDSTMDDFIVSDDQLGDDSFTIGHQEHTFDIDRGMCREDAISSPHSVSSENYESSSRKRSTSPLHSLRRKRRVILHADDASDPHADDASDPHVVVRSSVSVCSSESHADEVESLIDTPLLDRYGAQLRVYNESQEIETEILIQCGDELYNKWIKFVRPYSNLTDAAYDLFGYDRTDGYEFVSPDRITYNMREQCGIVTAVYYQYAMRDIMTLTEGDVVVEAFSRILKTIQTLSDLVQNTQMVRTSVDEKFALSEGVLPFHLGVITTQRCEKPLQNLILFLLRTAYVNGYRKHAGYIFEQIVTKSPATEEACPTHAWKPVCEIEEFVNFSISKEKNFDQWQNLLACGRNGAYAADYLASSVDFELPKLKPNRLAFSFLNGIVDFKEGKFYEYDSDEAIPSTLTSAKFHEAYFDPNNMLPETNWKDIETPTFERILRAQNIPQDAIDWVYIMFGRLMYDVGELDKWQVIMFLKGKAGTGKSTLGNVAKDMYNAADVAILSNNIEKTFGLSKLIEKFMFVCFEVKKDFKLDQGEFQCIVSGEQMSLPVKFKDAITMTWKSHGLLCGNEVASTWTDNSGSISRRVLLVEFNETVKNQDLTLEDSLHAEMGDLIAKFNFSYRSAAERYKGKGIWSIVPEYFQKTRRSLRCSTHDLYNMLNNPGEHDMEYDPNSRIRYEMFQETFNMYMSTAGKKKRELDKDYCAVAFAEFGLQIKVEPWGDCVTPKKWVCGIRSTRQNE